MFLDRKWVVTIRPLYSGNLVDNVVSLIDTLVSTRALQLVAVSTLTVIVFFFAFLEISLVLLDGRKQKDKKILSQTFLKVVSPTRSTWPSNYYQAISKNSKAICLCSETFIEDIIKADISRWGLVIIPNPPK